MRSRLWLRKGIALGWVFWALAVTAVLLWSLVPGYTIGWDSDVYAAALKALHRGGDPYAEGMARQVIYHQELRHRVDEPIPYTYVYSPMTLPFLSLLGRLRMSVLGTVFWTAYACGALLAIWIGVQAAAGDEERRVIALMAPSAIFFPGLLQNDVLFSGNIAYILYGLVLGSALWGWRKHRWLLFYVVVVLSSCWKAPLLSLLALPILSERRQWLVAGCTMVAGVLLFAIQPTIWPVFFRHYVEAVDLQFQWNHDFGCNPAGVLANALYDVVPYRVSSGVGYLLVVVCVLTALLQLRRRYFAGLFSLQQWWPLLTVGVVLMNPRIMEYDVAAITVPLALISWRFFRRRVVSLRLATAWWLGFLFTINAFAPFAWKGYAPFVGQVVQSLVLVIVFAAGCWDLFQQSSRAPYGSEELVNVAM